ncbi:MAG: quercetin 2,3-dioxygenase [Pseudonocardiales bacterium]|jgi:redox-sensitive bicupin YhaK (pirin superfamily)|nr:quercetin 2,3-dioxygenase [Pseudonocardiales bacterium]
MSNLETTPAASLCGAGSDVAAEPVFEPLDPRRVVLTPRQWSADDGAPAADPMSVFRFVPTRGRRMIGAWCFVDFYGPDDVSDDTGMLVPPHPHCGLQTVTWLLAGEVRHRDSIGSVQLIRPGQLNLMTAGAGISHAETSERPHSPTLHGVQLWVALPESERNRPAAFEHHADLPVWRAGGVEATVLIGELAGLRSPATAYTPLVGADIAISAGQASSVPLRSEWEHAVLVTSGAVEVEGRLLEHGQMAYLGCGRTRLSFSAAADARMLLLGGEPFEEEILMWWNFIARSHAEIVAAREEWMEGDRFGTVVDFDGDPLPAPPLPPLTLKPRGRV